VPECLPKVVLKLLGVLMVCGKDTILWRLLLQKRYAKNPELVLNFYNQRRKQLLEVAPNKAHFNLVQLEKNYDVEIITQNVDDLHERAGSTNVTHLHGELLKVRSTIDESIILDWKKELLLGDFCAKKSQLRPHIVWFGEMVPMLKKATKKVENADLLVIIGTAMQVYPAAGLINAVSSNTPIYFIDPNPAVSESAFQHLTILKDIPVSGKYCIKDVPFNFSLRFFFINSF
jgi:NAD-dependent deacetylase